jgi:hypothetical protein
VTYIASEVLLLAQDSLIPVQLDLEPSHELSHERLISLLTKTGLDHLFIGNHTGNRVELRILDTCSLLVPGDREAVSRYQRGAGSERGEVAADGARLVQLETIV